MKSVLIATIFLVGISLVFLGIIFFCVKAAKPRKWWEIPEPVQGDTPEPEKKPDSNRIYL